MVDLSEAYEQSLSRWSPDGKWLAGVSGFRLSVRALTRQGSAFANVFYLTI